MNHTIKGRRLLQRAQEIMDSPKLLENHRPATYIYNYCDGRYFIFALEVTYFIFALVKSQLDGKSSELNISLAKGNPSISSGSGPSFCHIIFLCICYISCDFRMLITAKLCIKRSPITLLHWNRYALDQSG